MAEDGEGGVALTVAEDAPEEVQREVAAAIEPFVPGSIESVERYIEQAAAARSPAVRGVQRDVPRLEPSVQGEADLAETETLNDLAGRHLLADPANAQLPAVSFLLAGDGLALVNHSLTFAALQ